MGEPTALARPSLERLKALDSLPDLSSQLAEVKELCTHSARADMIAKWLIEKLKSSEDARRDPDAWRTLLSTIRLLSPGRTASHLSSLNLIGTTKTALADSQDHAFLLSSLTDLFNFLAEVSNGSTGAPVKAVLSVPSIHAASFLGVWLQRVCVAAISTVNDLWPLLSPAIKVWEQRKRSVEDNDLFARQCLVPAASLLSHLPVEAGSLSKRKRHDHTELDNGACRPSIESLLARHIFLPTRTAFFNAQDFAGNKGQRHVESQHPMTSLESMLEPLKNSIVQNEEVDDELLKALPLLLDIGLRSAPPPTPRHRMREMPWIENLFDAVLECNKDISGNVRSLSSLVVMLSTVGKRASLSKDKLKRIVEFYSNLWGDLEAEVDWMLLSRVIKLNADLFVDDGMAEKLFSALTMAGVRLGDNTIERIESIEQEDLQRLWKDEIVIPVMRAFSRSRKLVDFVGLWSRYLKQDQHNEIWSVWVEIEDPFQNFLEKALTQDQIMRLLDRFYKPIQVYQKLRNDAESSYPYAEINTSVVILNAVLAGVRSNTVHDEMQQRYNGIFHTVLQLVESGTVGHMRRKWALLTKAFETWLPAWAALEDVDVISEEGLSILSGTVVDIALADLDMRAADKNSALALPGEKEDARYFVASVCHHFSKYDQNEVLQAGCVETVERLVKRLNGTHIGALLRYPKCLVIMDHAVRNALLEMYIATAARIEHDEQISVSAFQALRAIAAMAVSQAQAAVIDDMIGVAVGVFEAKDLTTREHSDSVQSTAVDLLLEFPAASLTRVQRERIIDTICDVYLVNASPLPEGNLQKCLALLVKLMEMSNATSALMTDTAALWRLVVGFDPSDNHRFRKGFDEYHPVLKHTTTALIEELATRTLTHLLATQDQDRSRFMITHFSAMLEHFVEYYCSSSNTHVHVGALALTRSIMSQTDTLAKDALKTKLPHYNLVTMSKFMDTLFIMTINMSPEVLDSESTNSSPEKSIELHAMLETLIAIPRTLTSGVGLSLASNNWDLMKFVESMLDSYDFEQTTPGGSCDPNAQPNTLKSALVRCYETVSNYGLAVAPSHVAELAIRLLQLQLNPVEHEAMIMAFERWILAIPGPARLGLVKKLLVDVESPSSASLPIIQVCISKLEKPDMDSILDFAPSRPLHALLKLAASNRNFMTSRWATVRIAKVLREKPFMVNQYTIEAILAALPKMVRNSPAPSILYLDACQIISTMLLQHRSRLQGRFHIVIRVYQELISLLFTKSKTSTSNHSTLSTKHARALARLLTLFCSPPPPRRQTKTSGSSSLIDESRKEQAHVGQYVHNILHHYCAQILHGGILGDGVREALMPGLWAVIEAMEINGAEGVKCLSAAMDNSERAVLRGVFEEWRRFGKWRGG